MKDLIEKLLKEKNLDKDKAEEIKRKWANRHRVPMPLSSAVLDEAKTVCSGDECEILRKALMTKPTRTLSGVSVVAVAYEPTQCPGKCVYCPKGANAPQSYTGYEPAIMRAIANNYDPYKQVKNRLQQLQDTGHSTEKSELIIMGGTFPAQDWEYQKWFVKRCFDGFNSFDSDDLVSAQRFNETARNRVIGLTIETRPDYVFPEKFLELGCTRVELGVQSVYDSVLKKVCRGHSVKDTIDAAKKLKDHGYKILYQVMLGLPGSSPKKDIVMFKKLFTDPNFKPDMLKIYPTLVVPGSKLYGLWKKGEYKPMHIVDVREVLENVFETCPPWVRIHRIQRDIPKEQVVAGPVKSNIREELLNDWDRKKKWSNEIRFREAGQILLRRKKRPENEQIFVEKYKASGGDEYFISVEDEKHHILVGFCRLRITVSKKAFIRELHVYGETLPIGAKKGMFQHIGWGHKLLAKAEELAKKAKCKSIYVISGVGAREYYRKVRYQFKSGYMWKNLK